jgi:AraC-like DNA-binding protein
MTEIFDDIRKLYQFRRPCPELEEYIEFFSETSVDATAHYVKSDNFNVRLFPSFTPTIWINLGSPYHINNGRETKSVGKTSDILVLRSTMLERQNLPTDNIFTIKFRPLGFEAIFGKSQATIGNDIISANKVLDQAVFRFLKSTIPLHDKVCTLEKIFLEKFEKNSKDRFHLQCIKKSINHYLLSDMQSNVGDLAAHVNVSEKTFNRYFYQAIGTNPKYFFLITRCRTALTNYVSNRTAFSPFDFGYYDFGHFSKDVYRFTGSNLTFLKS